MHKQHPQTCTCSGHGTQASQAARQGRFWHPGPQQTGRKKASCRKLCSSLPRRHTPNSGCDYETTAQAAIDNASQASALQNSPSVSAVITTQCIAACCCVQDSLRGCLTAAATLWHGGGTACAAAATRSLQAAAAGLSVATAAGSCSRAAGAQLACGPLLHPYKHTTL